jgi:hypothetical protein
MGTKLFFLLKNAGDNASQDLLAMVREQEAINTMNQALLNNQKNLTQAILMRPQSATNNKMLSVIYLTCRLLVKLWLNILCMLEWLTLSKMAE